MKKVLLRFICFFFCLSVSAQTPNTSLAKQDLRSESKAFRKNLGQYTSATFPHTVLFAMSQPGLDIYLTDRGISYFFYKSINEATTNENKTEQHGINISWERIELELVNSAISAENIQATQPLSAHHNYFTSARPEGIYNVRDYQDLVLKNVYPKIDWHLYFTANGQLKYDFIVHEGADASLIQLNYLSPKGAVLAADGALDVRAQDYTLKEQAPFCYLANRTTTISSKFEIMSHSELKNCLSSLVRFNLANYDHTKTLVIDPTLYWSTAFGGSLIDYAKAIQSDAVGNIYVTGKTQSTNFILQNAGTFFQGTGSTNGQVIILKFNTAHTLVWSTYYGGSSNDQAYAMAIDKAQNLYIGGAASSPNFPIQSNGGYFQANNGGVSNAFILKFDTSGVRKWATCYGGSNHDGCLSLACNSKGSVYMSGYTYSTNFPLLNTSSFFSAAPTTSTNTRGYLVKFDSAGTRQWATCYQGNHISAIHCDKTDHLVVTGATAGPTHTLNPGNGAYFQSSAIFMDAFIGRFTETGAFVWGTYYGGNNTDEGRSIITDSQCNIFLAGWTNSSDLPLVGDENAYQQTVPTFSLPSNYAETFLAKFDSSGVQTWATYYGGPGFDEMLTYQNLALDPCDRLYYAIESLAASSQTACEGGFMRTTAQGIDQHLVRFSNTGARQWATMLGGDGPEVYSAICIDPKGNLYITGQWDPTSSATYTYVNPGAGASFSTNPQNSPQGFVAKFTGAVLNPPAQYVYPTICSNLTSSMLPQFNAQFVPGGTFHSSSPKLTVHPVSGLITLANTPPGNYTISYTRLACTCDQSKLQVAIQDCSGIEKSMNRVSHFEIFPNPSNGLFIVRSSSMQHLSVVNGLGQTVKIIPLPANTELAVDLSDLPNGIYYIQAEHQNSTSQKLIIIH